MKTILVTGGAGYIGSHACKALRLAGYEPVVFDSFVTGWRDAVKFGQYFEGDLQDFNAISQVMREVKPDAIMHFAALSLVGESMQDPARYWRNNTVGSLNLAQAAVENDVKSFVFSSTCATYGEQDGVRLDENAKQMPINAYGASKRAFEDILSNFDTAFGLKSVIFRYFNVAGADPEAEIGEDHRPETHLIPVAFDAIRGQRDKLTIFGDDYNTKDGTCIRDYVHVCDLVDAHVLGLKYLEENGVSRAFNLGTKDGFSVREVIDTIEEVTGETVPHEIGPRRAGDATSLVSGSERAETELGWSPRRSNLREIVGDAWRWHQRPSYKQ